MDRLATASEWLDRARDMATQGKDRWRDAGEAMAKARERDPALTQRQIAVAVGMSLGWVNGILKWRDGGYVDTPFGPAARNHRQAVQSTEQDAEDDGAEHNGPTGSDIDRVVKNAIDACLVIAELSPTTLVAAGPDNLVRLLGILNEARALCMDVIAEHADRLTPQPVDEDALEAHIVGSISPDKTIHVAD
jgi:hypothetical protein